MSTSAVVTITPTSTVIDKKTEFHVQLASLMSILYIAQSALGSVQCMALNTLCDQMDGIRIPKFACDQEQILEDATKKVKDYKEKMDLEDPRTSKPWLIIPTICNFVISNYEQIASHVGRSIVDGHITDNMIENCDKMMDLNFHTLKFAINWYFKPVFLFYLSITERLIRLTNSNINCVEHPRLVKKFNDLLFKFGVTIDYAYLFVQKFSYTNLSPFLPTILPKELIETIVIKYTQLTCNDTVDIAKLLTKNNF
jgi:hypothetical protein